ncbi:CCHC-type domain-containing protein [Trichonephila inaurata madagascariensis]|uniref:CCHC-type domain-containing protein n=1 Tax=Trichonephila inaurata madagascariensis TaxID=2747483 RepID=A0A8X7CNE5_9ARAC|nr:CCHC-type domain-containing protein [Trichonephila inaurata madagascariensis]
MTVPPSQYEAPRKTDLWRTADSRPVCFHCGRPGHVVRYCRERRAIFNDYRRNNPRNYNLPDERQSRRTHPTKIKQSSSRKITNTPYEVPITDAIPNFQPVAKPRGKLSRSPSIGGEVANFRTPPLAAKLHGNHIDVFIDHQPVKALVDSGASNSVISETYRRKQRKVVQDQILLREATQGLLVTITNILKHGSVIPPRYTHISRFTNSDRVNPPSAAILRAFFDWKNTQVSSDSVFSVRTAGFVAEASRLISTSICLVRKSKFQTPSRRCVGKTSFSFMDGSFHV